jgi:DNA polymerase-3 subunit alpha
VIPWTEHEKMSFEKELLGFYVTGHPLDAYARVLAHGNYQTIASLNELTDRAPFRIGGAIVQVDKKFTKKEGKPFAVIWLEDLTSKLEVVLWNEIYTKVSEVLLPGRVIAVRGILDRRDDGLRAVAQDAKVLPRVESESPQNGQANGQSHPDESSALVLYFSASVGPEELRQVQSLLAASPGHSPVRLVFSRSGAERIEMDAGNDLRVTLTPDLRHKLMPWLRVESPASASASAAIA